MIEMEIPKDIRKYEAKLIGPLTTRQTVCFVGAAALALSVFFLLDFIPQDVRYFLIILVAAPFLLCGWYKPYGMPFEKFVQTAFITSVLAPANRKYASKNIYESEIKKVEESNNKKNKNSKNNKNNKIKQSKEFIAYK